MERYESASTGAGQPADCRTDPGHRQELPETGPGDQPRPPRNLVGERNPPVNWLVTRDLAAARRFTDAVDAGTVVVNASTRFTDGAEFGFGAEIGISTQKLHARGPMALRELTTHKYVVWGDGQIRN